MGNNEQSSAARNYFLGGVIAVVLLAASAFWAFYNTGTQNESVETTEAGLTSNEAETTVPEPTEQEVALRSEINFLTTSPLHVRGVETYSTTSSNGVWELNYEFTLEKFERRTDSMNFPSNVGIRKKFILQISHYHGDYDRFNRIRAWNLHNDDQVIFEETTPSDPKSQIALDYVKIKKLEHGDITIVLE